MVEKNGEKMTKGFQVVIRLFYRTNINYIRCNNSYSLCSFKMLNFYSCIVGIMFNDICWTGGIDLHCLQSTTTVFRNKGST